MSTFGDLPKRLDLRSIFADRTCLSCRPPEVTIAFTNPSESNCSFRNPEKERLGAVYALSIGNQPASNSVPPSHLSNTPIDPWETLEQLDKKAKMLLRQGGYAHDDEEALRELAALKPPKGEPFSPENMRSVVDTALASKTFANSRSAVDIEPSSAQTTKPFSEASAGYTQYRMELVAARIEKYPETGTYATYQTKLSQLPSKEGGGQQQRRKAIAASQTILDPIEM